MELNATQSFIGVDCALESGPVTRSRVGDTRKLSPNYNYMDVSMDNVEDLLPQGEFGYSQGPAKRRARRCWVEIE